MKIYGLIFTDTFTDTTFLFFQIKAAFIDISDKGNGLREVYMNGFIGRYILIIGIRDLDWAVFHTGRTTRASVLDNVSGLLGQSYRKVSRFPCYTFNFSKGENLYVWMPADLDQFG